MTTRRQFRLSNRAARQRDKINRLTGPSTFGGGQRGSKQLPGTANRYNKTLAKLGRTGGDTSGFQPFDWGTGGFQAPPSAATGGGPTAAGAPPPATPAAGAEPGSVEDVTASPFGPGFDKILNQLAQGFPAGIDINTERGARAIETLFPLIQHAYNTQMQEEGIGTAAKSVDEYRNDPLLKGVAAGMADKLTNPYTFDDQTVQLMQNRVAEDMANQEAAMGERLRSLGADVGMDPSSPRYASAAAQAAMMRDINQTRMQRDLDIDMARQRQTDEYQALGAAGQFGGAYQSGLGQRYAGLTGAQLGGKFQNIGNPFAGLWEGLLMEGELNSDDGANPWGGALTGAAGGAAAGAPLGPYGMAAGAVVGGAGGYFSGK